MKINQKVITRRGEIGTVARMFDDFSAVSASCWSMSGQDWLDAQENPFTESELLEPWYTVVLDMGGSVWSPESLLIAFN